MLRFFGKLYVQVLIGVTAGVLVGVFWPQLGSDLKPLGDAFIKLIKMVFAPIIFATVVLGRADGNMKELGRVGVQALIYFEVVDLALLICPRRRQRPPAGSGMNIDPRRSIPSHRELYRQRSKADGIVDSCST
jgi:aerobic C4-dicarboxylate transport protein